MANTKRSEKRYPKDLPTYISIITDYIGVHGLEYTDCSTQRECCFGHDGLALWARKSFSGEVIAFIRPAAIMEKRSKWA